MNAERASRLLSIGEFAAATQLTPKALRLYDEQRLLPPASIDATNGYRYYSRAQVKLGRLIRTLRDMDLPLEEIAAVVTAEGARAEMLLRHFALELDRRFAREKRALQAALMLMRASPGGDALAIVERERDAMTVAVSAFTATRERLVENYRMQLARMRDTARARRLVALWRRLLRPDRSGLGRRRPTRNSLAARCTAPLHRTA